MNTAIKKVLPLLIAAAAGAGTTWVLSDFGTARQADAQAPAIDQPPKVAEAAHAEAIQLNEQQLAASGLRVETAKLSAFGGGISLPGQLVLNTDREARVLSPVAGLVRSAPVQIGTQVKAGAVLATIESAQLSEAAARYLAARERQALAQTSFLREEGLWQKKISAEQDYLAARREVNEARIETQNAMQSLLALGMSEADARALKSGSRLASYALRSPVAGTVLSKAVTLGEAVASDKPLFRVADLSTLWIDLAVPVSELGKVHAGQTVSVSDKSGLQSEGRVIFVQPELDEASRSGSVRVQLDNAQGQWRAGQFVQAQVRVGTATEALSVPYSAIQTLDGQSVVFVASKAGITPHAVVTGRRDGDRQEIVSGLQAGEQYVTGNVFVLKAELKKGEAGHDD